MEVPTSTCGWHSLAFYKRRKAELTTRFEFKLARRPKGDCYLSCAVRAFKHVMTAERSAITFALECAFRFMTRPQEDDCTAVKQLVT